MHKRLSQGIVAILFSAIFGANAASLAVTNLSFGNGAGYLPVSEGGTNQSVAERWRVSFTEDLTPATVNDANNFDLRAAGADGQFDTPDDVRYTVTEEVCIPSVDCPGLDAG